jgi:ABC-type phosphate/phosphonate transport system permease subunit
MQFFDFQGLTMVVAPSGLAVVQQPKAACFDASQVTTVKVHIKIHNIGANGKLTVKTADRLDSRDWEAVTLDLTAPGSTDLLLSKTFPPTMQGYLRNFLRWEFSGSVSPSVTFEASIAVIE